MMWWIMSDGSSKTRTRSRPTSGNGSNTVSGRLPRAIVSTSRIGAANTMYEIILSRQAARYLERLDRMAQQRIIDRLEQLAKNPRDLFTKPLTNAEGLRSSRVGTWRIVYRIDEPLHEVQVSDIAPRGEVYRRL
ncbi:MAG: hypothetical protein C7B45_02830 [Sulfobacillus acidophilus]|uniref:Type II toxin-antitoxin system RelE/ParE family toxin n=1 Tax=Sulfobacillus acidophilus TaxID=53633 RepID=A0A2T2WMM5_9FIRM|nr:MAG: hypothetical protein C7B45_02830 [Sulfobacillus acidophilus]